MQLNVEIVFRHLFRATTVLTVKDVHLSTPSSFLSFQARRIVYRTELLKQTGSVPVMQLL